MSDVRQCRKVLFLEARNFGDAIIKNTLIFQYGVGHPEEQIDLWAKRQFADIFSRNTRIHKVHHSGFPIAGMKSWNIITLARTIWTLRKERYDLAIDTMGDFRERLLLWLAHPKRIISIEREQGHPFNHLIRRGLSFLVEPEGYGKCLYPTCIFNKVFRCSKMDAGTQRAMCFPSNYWNTSFCQPEMQIMGVGKME